MKLGRREFINALLSLGGAGGLASILYPVSRYLIPPKITEPKVTSLKVGPLNDFAINSSKIVRFGRVPVILIRSQNGDFKALAATCTHLDCIVQYDQGKQQIVCACHNGIYDLNGKNVSGPPPKPLDEYVVSVIEDQVILSMDKGVA